MRNFDDIKTAFINQLNKIIDDNIIAKTKELLDSAAFNTTPFEEKCEKLKAEAEAVINEINREIKINSTIAQDQAEYTARYNSLCDKYRSLQERIEECHNSIADLKARKNRASEFFNNISVLNKPITEFDEYLWNILVEKAIVYGKDDIRIVWSDGDIKL